MFEYIKENDIQNEFTSILKENNYSIVTLPKYNITDKIHLI